ncbi:hypothetical protein [Nubsella zeaxanthinifaciens]|jgi:hypothetical protein|uniref:hypothetical protein n=1 Tax=Nubsella zeaxanthinifaciens TaxID=392412 RepID=UPI000DE44FCA|nr:hypothetical protein [Nubsella zeaxanthinifaciens]
MKKITLLLISLCWLQVSFAQEITKQEKGYFNLTELGYFAVNNDYETQITPSSFSVIYDGAYAISLRNINGWFVTNKLSVGLGVGLENYTRKSSSAIYDNTFQIFLDARYYLKNKVNTFFAYADVGSSVAISDVIEKGPMFNLGLGYKLKMTKRTALVGSLGFIDQTIKEEAPVYKNRYYGFAFKVGLLL